MLYHRNVSLPRQTSDIPARTPFRNSCPRGILKSVAMTTLASFLLLGELPQATAHPEGQGVWLNRGQTSQPSATSRQFRRTTKGSQLYSQQPRRRRVKFVPPAPTFERGAPSNRGHNASRNANSFSLTTLVPQYLETATDGLNPSTAKQHVWTLTSSPQPVFWAHIPVQADTAPESLTFVLRDQAGQKLYEAPIEPPEESSIIRIANADMPALQPGQPYHWFIKYKVRDLQPEGGQIMRDHDEGWIEYRPSSLSAEGKSLTEQAALYANAGYWHEALDAVAQQRQANPQDAAALLEWEGLLADIQLEILAQEPLR